MKKLSIQNYDQSLQAKIILFLDFGSILPLFFARLFYSAITLYAKFYLSNFAQKYNTFGIKFTAAGNKNLLVLCIPKRPCIVIKASPLGLQLKYQ